MVRIGIVGVGFMGMIHYLAARQVRGATVAAICSRDEKKLAGDWRSIQGNFGPRGDMIDLAGVKRYRELGDLLADPDIDLVDICNPTHLHAETAIRALQAGKHVLVEKPIALDTKDANAMLVAARQADQLLMVAHVLPFFPEFAYAAQAIRGGAHGKLLAAHFKRIISKPDWSTAIGDTAKTGGPAVDLHIHDTHFIALACGMPNQVFSTGVISSGAVEYLTTAYSYAPAGPAITCSCGALTMKGRPFAHGYELYFENATLIYESGARPLMLLKADGTTEQPKLEGGSDPIAAFTREIQAAVDGINNGRASNILNGKLARDALVLCHREIESVKTGKPVHV